MGKNKGTKGKGGNQALLAAQHGAVPDFEVDAVQEVEMLLAVPKGDQVHDCACYVCV